MADKWAKNSLKELFGSTTVPLVAMQTAEMAKQTIAITQAITTMSANMMLLLGAVPETILPIIEQAKSAGAYLLYLPPEVPIYDVKVAVGYDKKGVGGLQIVGKGKGGVLGSTSKVRPKSWTQRIASASAKGASAAFPAGFPPNSGVCAAVCLILSAPDIGAIKAQYNNLITILTTDMSNISAVLAKWKKKGDALKKAQEDEAAGGNPAASLLARMEELKNKKGAVSRGIAENVWCGVTVYDMLQGPIDSMQAKLEGALKEVKSIKSDIAAFTKMQADLTAGIDSMASLMESLQNTGCYSIVLNPVDEAGEPIEGGFLSRASSAPGGPPKNGSQYQAGVVILLVAPNPSSISQSVASLGGVAKKAVDTTALKAAATKLNATHTMIKTVMGIK